MPNAKVDGAMLTKGPLAVRVKLWVALGLTPLLAVKPMLNVPPVVGVPERVAVPLPLLVKVTPEGRLPDSVMLVGTGKPVVVTVNELAAPRVKAA